MDKPQNGFEFLEELSRRNGKKVQTHSSLFEYLDTKAREKGIPLHGQFELTPLCNFNCKMCYVHLDDNHLVSQKVMVVDKWKDLVRQAFEAGMMSATLTGGECLVYPGFDEIYLYLRDLGCEVSVLTNGYLLDDTRISFFEKYMPQSIKITLYGCDDDVYERVTGRRAFSRVVENIRKSINAGLPISLSVTPSKYLGQDVLKTIRMGKSLTQHTYVNSTLFDPRDETGKSGLKHDSDLDTYIQIYKLMNELDGRETKEIEEDKLPPVGGPSHECTKCGLMCGGGRSGFVIDWKGTLMPCNRLEMIQAYPLKDGFKKAWETVNSKVKAWPRVAECIECAYRNVCNNCAANMLKYAEPGKQPVELCNITRCLVKHGIRHISECD